MSRRRTRTLARTGLHTVSNVGGRTGRRDGFEAWLHGQEHRPDPVGLAARAVRDATPEKLAEVVASPGVRSALREARREFEGGAPVR